MTSLKTHYRICGLGAEKQLQFLQDKGFILYDIRKIGPNCLELAVGNKYAAHIYALLTARGFDCTALAPRGVGKQVHAMQRHAPFLIPMLIMMLLLSSSLRHIWRIDIRGAGVYAGEVRACLTENGYHVGMPGDDVDLRFLIDTLTHRLPRVAWVHARTVGLTLQIDITQGVPMPQIETQGDPADIIASKDGVIEAVYVYAGTPLVREGDSVRAGDVLIRGQERGKDGAFIPVRARGRVIAAGVLTANACVSARSYLSERTGENAAQILLHLSGHSIPLSKAPDFLTSEAESRFYRAGTLFLPLIVEKRTVYEVALSESVPDEDRLKAESARLAMQKLLLLCGENDEIVDKWLDYSMIEGGNIVATVHARIRTDIAVSAPETPE